MAVAGSELPRTGAERHRLHLALQWIATTTSAPRRGVAYRAYGIRITPRDSLRFDVVKTDKLCCPACSAPLSATEVLEACSVSVAGAGVLRLRCPRCAEAALARIVDGRIELGAAGGEGGAAFLPTTVSVEPELYVRWDGGWVDCWHRKVYRRFPVGA